MDQLRPPSELKLSGKVAENWRRFKQGFELYMSAINADEKPEKQKIAIFLTVAGQEAIDVFNTFTFTEEQKDKIDEVLKKFAAYCEPKQNETYEMYIFCCRLQKQGESVEQWITDLKNKSQTCNFGTLADSMIRDQIVVGTNDPKLKERLLRESNLTLDTAVQICQSVETTQQQLQLFASEDVRSINAVGQNSNKKKPFKPRGRGGHSQGGDRQKSAPTKSSTKPCEQCCRNHEPR